MGYLTSLTAEERFFRNVNRDSGIWPDESDPLVLIGRDKGPCWICSGSYNSNGYPRYNSRTTDYGTIPYRICWRYLRGEIQNQLDHLCRNPGCVNPDHLEDVTSRVNTLRSNNPTARNARKTHCSRGHEFNELNTVVDAKGHRHCRICSRLTNTEWARKKRARLKEGEK